MSLVYADKPQTLDHLEDNIRRVIADIRPQMLEKVIENWTSRLDYIRASPMPEIIFTMDIDGAYICMEEARTSRSLKTSLKYEIDFYESLSAEKCPCLEKFAGKLFCRPASMVDMSLGLSPEMDSRLERKSSAPLLVICWDHRL
ncbi:hypothetical protein TNCV_2466811 [Trichonephila clavipes]|nr:hypothetical protein TNCV_2466811 [Trichonephila clavipes]